MKLLVLLIGSVVFTVLSLVTVRFWGLNQNYSAYEHRFFKQEKPWVVAHWEQSFFSEKIPGLILYANVYKTDHELFLVRPSIEEKIKNQKSEQSPSPARPLLQDFLKNHSTFRVVLNFEDNLAGIDQQIENALKDYNRTENIMIQSPYNSVLESVRKLESMFVYGSTMSDTMRFKTFDSIGIISVSPFKGDIYFSELKVKGKDAITKSISSELERRKIPIIIGPIKDFSEAQLALSLGASGLFIEKPEAFLNWLSQGLTQGLSHQKQ